MTVYLGGFGEVQLQRTSEGASKSAVISAADVNTARRRFSFDFDSNFLVSGDRIEIASTNGATLAFMPTSAWNVGAKQPAGSWFAHIDELGGIRLYGSYAESLAGDVATAYALEAIVADIPITVTIVNDTSAVLAQVASFELNTNRQVVDVTCLGDEFEQKYSTLISGSGSFNAFWDYLPPKTAIGASNEVSNYLLQLAIRTEAGSQFKAKLYLKKANIGENLPPNARDDEIWYEFDGVITEAAVNFEPASAVQITANYVTTGPIRLRTRVIAQDKILQENLDDIRLEQDATASLLQEGAL